MVNDNKIAPIGGTHRSAHSLLAEIMNDPQVTKVVVFTFREDGNIGVANFDITNAEMAYVSVVAAHLSLGDSE